MTHSSPESTKNMFPFLDIFYPAPLKILAQEFVDYVMVVSWSFMAEEVAVSETLEGSEASEMGTVVDVFSISGEMLWIWP